MFKCLYDLYNYTWFSHSLSLSLFLSLPPSPHLSDSCSYKLEKENLCVSELFEMLDSVKVEVGILDWGIKMTTLEDGEWTQCDVCL